MRVRLLAATVAASIVLLSTPVAAQWAGPKTGVVDNNGNQVFTPMNPAPVTSTPSATAPSASQSTGSQYQFSVNSAVALPSQPASGATLAEVVCQTQSIFYTTISGATPTASTGMGPVIPGTFLYFWRSSIAAAKIIGVASGGTCSVEYFQ